MGVIKNWWLAFAISGILTWTGFAGNNSKKVLTSETAGSSRDVSETESTDACKLLFSTATSLTLDDQATRAHREYVSYGNVAKEGSLGDLPEGRYLYLIDRNGDTIWSPEVPDLTVNPDDDNAPIVVSHRSLAQFQRIRKNTEPDIIAGGEFVIIKIGGQSKVQELNNRSRTYKGEGSTILIGDQVLNQYGLATDEKTIRVDYSQPGLVTDRHVPRQKAAIDLVRYHNSTELKNLRNLTQTIVRMYPVPKSHSVIDLKKLKEALARAYKTAEKNSQIDPNTEQNVFAASRVFPLIKDWGEPSIVDLIDRSGTTVEQVVSSLRTAGFFDLNVGGE